MIEIVDDKGKVRHILAVETFASRFPLPPGWTVRRR